MSFFTNPNAHLITIQPLQGVITSATGTSNTTTNAGALTTFNSSGGSSVKVTSNVYLSNASILYNGTNLLTSNTLNTRLYTSFQVDTVEQARFTSNGLGIWTSNPVAPLQVWGDTVIQEANLYVSSFGMPITSTIGNIFADGYVWTAGIMFPSDAILKENITPYILSNGLPNPVEFTWKSSGKRDIGVIAGNVQEVESSCVENNPNGTQAVNYPKLVVLCLAELKELREIVTKHEKTIQELQAMLTKSP
jgi:hypothetical protein